MWGKETALYTIDLQLIGKRLKKYRENLGLSQPQVAELAHISDRTLSNAENGSNEMRVLTLLQICNALDIPILELLTTEAEMPDYKSELTKFLDDCTPTDLERFSRLISYFKYFSK